MSQLPYEYNINVPALSSVFASTTNSYKFLFFQALLSLFKNSHFKKDTFTFDELEEEILEIARYPINVFKLNFGTQDKISENIQGKSTNLMKYVPYRLLTPFFANQLSGMKDGDKNKMIEKLSNENRQFNSVYKIIGNKVELYVEWAEYLKSHYAIIESWVFWHWVNYLQGKNPNAIALVSKLQKPSVRASLSHQTKYWKTILNHTELHCIFSKKTITKQDISLDHFLPWSFIGHDQLWNLIPVSRSVNSSKSDNIPSMDNYLDKFVSMQLLGLEVSHKNMSKRVWENQVDDFVLGLNIDFPDLLNQNKIIVRNYREIVPPLANVAHNMGFNAGWVFKQ